MQTKVILNFFFFAGVFSEKQQKKLIPHTGGG